jgi:hypothetical protein
MVEPASSYAAISIALHFKQGTQSLRHEKAVSQGGISEQHAASIFRVKVRRGLGVGSGHRIGQSEPCDEGLEMEPCQGNKERTLLRAPERKERWREELKLPLQWHAKEGIIKGKS